MPDRDTEGRSLRLRPGQPLIGVVVREDGEKVTRFFTGNERDNDRSRERASKKMRAFAGIWSDLDWDETEPAFDRIRHQSKPTPPLLELLNSACDPYFLR